MAITHPHFILGSFAGVPRLVKEKPFPVLRGEIVNAVTAFAPVYVKLLPRPLANVEAVCAWLAHEVALPLPRPVCAIVHRRLTTRLCAWPYGSSARAYCFGTQEIPLALRLRDIDNTQYGQSEQLLSGWRDCLRVGIFDELISNDDRNNGNILVDAQKRLWIIDHSRALRAGGQSAFSDPMLPFENALLRRFAGLAPAHRHALRSKIVADCTQLSSAAARIPYDDLDVRGEAREAIEKFIDTRARHLAALVLARLGISELPIGDQLRAGLH